MLLLRNKVCSPEFRGLTGSACDNIVVVSALLNVMAPTLGGQELFLCALLLRFKVPTVEAIERPSFDLISFFFVATAEAYSVLWFKTFKVWNLSEVGDKAPCN